MRPELCILSPTAGWQWGLWAPGMIGGVVAIIILLTLKARARPLSRTRTQRTRCARPNPPPHRHSFCTVTVSPVSSAHSRSAHSPTRITTPFQESPEAAGFPPVEDPKKALEAKKAKETVATAGDDDEKLSLLQNLKKNVLSNPFIWGLALTYFCVYIIRQAVTSWSVFYLIKEKGVVDAGAAALRVSGLEIGGLLGSLVAGRISDYAIAKGGPGGAVGKRVKVVMVYMVGVAVTLMAFKLSPPGVGWLQSLCVFMIGFFLYGPQMLIGLCGAEIVGRRSVGASEGFLVRRGTTASRRNTETLPWLNPLPPLSRPVRRLSQHQR